MSHESTKYQDAREGTKTHKMACTQQGMTAVGLQRVTAVRSGWRDLDDMNMDAGSVWADI